MKLTEAPIANLDPYTGELNSYSFHKASELAGMSEIALKPIHADADPELKKKIDAELKAQESLTYHWTYETAIEEEDVRDTKAFYNYLNRAGIAYKKVEDSPNGFPIIEYTGTKAALWKLVKKYFVSGDSAEDESNFYDNLEPSTETRRRMSKFDLTDESLAVDRICQS